ncbi:MAG TPA: serpin family protein [Candidatus Angelobacter sp.]
MRILKLCTRLSLFLVVLSAIGCAQAIAANSFALMSYRPEQSSNAQSASTAANTFGLKLLADLAAHRPHDNVFISPLSVFVALTMTETGAAGKTQAAMRHALAVPSSLSEHALHESASALLKALALRKGVELSIANALWSDVRLPLSAGFIEKCRQLYAADATTLDFSHAATASTINKWVSEHTHGKIPTIVNPVIVKASNAILTNAVYFKGRWEYQFSKNETKDESFHLADGREKKVPMMHQSFIEDAYRSGDGYEAAALPYENSGMQLYAILPAAGKTPEQALAQVSVEKLRRPSEPNKLDLRLPRFTLDFDAGLKEPLSRMGMGVAFTPEAEFAPIGSPKFVIGDVLHKTRLEIDEEGTVAAATTVVVMPATAMKPPPRKDHKLVFDRPFVLLLCDDESGAILFAGVVYEPR